jgi:hypothetical protein
MSIVPAKILGLPVLAPVLRPDKANLGFAEKKKTTTIHNLA